MKEKERMNELDFRRLVDKTGSRFTPSHRPPGKATKVTRESK